MLVARFPLSLTGTRSHINMFPLPTKISITVLFITIHFQYILQINAQSFHIEHAYFLLFDILSFILYLPSTITSDAFLPQGCTNDKLLSVISMLKTPIKTLAMRTLIM